MHDGRHVRSLRVPGLATSVVGDPEFATSTRTATNEWVVSTRRAAREGAVVHVEHDTCGTWATVTNHGGPRPIVLRRAGWLDVRGHPTPELDRVGLGPGDSMLLFSAALTTSVDGSGEPFGADALPTLLLHSTQLGAEDLAFACWSSALRSHRPSSGVPAIAVLQVPPDLSGDPLARLVAATGVPADELRLPGYPLGDQQPDLWHQPPTPPREARLLLRPDACELSTVRRLLQRLLSSWRLDHLLEQGDVTLLANEIATNAIAHTKAEAVVIVRYLGDRVRVEVGDSSARVPLLLEPPPTEPGGRGVQLISALSSSWGVERTKQGKRVWFEVPTTLPAFDG